jgi:hypothetical protein
MAFAGTIEFGDGRGTVDLEENSKLARKSIDLKSAWPYSGTGLGHPPLADDSLGEAPRRITSRHVQNMLQDGNAGTIRPKHILY